MRLPSRLININVMLCIAIGKSKSYPLLFMDHSFLVMCFNNNYINNFNSFQRVNKIYIYARPQILYIIILTKFVVH